MEELFFASYGGLITITMKEFMDLPVDDIDWFVKRLIEEKEKERNALRSPGR